jgi:hypothetical protein
MFIKWQRITVTENAHFMHFSSSCMGYVNTGQLELYIFMSRNASENVNETLHDFCEQLYIYIQIFTLWVHFKF